MRWLVHIALLLPLFASAQPGRGSVDVRMDTTVIRIGERAKLHMEVSYPAGISLIWPAVGDTLTAHIEVVADSGVDTTEGSEGLMRQLRTLSITSFDSGFWAVPPFRFIVNGTPMDSDPLLIEVRTVQVDVTKPVRDIKDIHELPFSIAYWIRKHLLWIAGGAALVALAVAIVLLLRRRKPAVAQAEPEVQLPLNERITAALHALEKERVWQQGDHKTYHSRLTDLLRGYVEERYRVPALESTTDELLKELRVSPLSTDQRGQLENMLRLADMVKFAKTLPSPQENEQMMAGALRFVRETAPRPNPPGHA
ncbi:MAG: hypothetical protein KF797_03725 [Flavobacteriales bacterium]|nr:hypothetical protein [Flavobacteriales bacterium]